MDVSSLATAASNAGFQDGVATTVLKKAMKADADSVTQLINTLPESGGTNNPAHLGQNIDVKA
jgi:hypothetical protein